MIDCPSGRWIVMVGELAWRSSCTEADHLAALSVLYEESGNPSWSQVNTIGSILISTCILGEENEEDEYERSRKREGQII